MSSVGVAFAAFFAAFVAWVGARSLARTMADKPIALDDTFCGSLRKFHVQPIPRVGGLAVAAGMLGGACVDWAVDGDAGMWPLLLVCVAPGFIWGLVEDLSKRGAVPVRLALTGVAAGLGFILLDARITQVDVPGLDNLLALHAFSFAFTVFAVTGIAHAVNVIDGLNGLSSVNALLASIGLAVVAWTVGDDFVFCVACVLAGSVAGFFLINYPRGRIFLGDGGAYLIGLLLAELSVLLVHRNSEVSPWFPLLLLAYPIWETLFSMYRRRMRGRSTGEADALHLHSLVYRRMARWKGYAAAPADYVARNSIASACLWVLPASCLAIALSFWGNSLVLQSAAVIFAIVYTWLYFRIVRFGMPGWMTISSRATTEPEGDGEQQHTA
jgi:UDP-N-acetylmuramyl pentapeptide phosphotransferase/UDP-N-acetylglucosamine-1-phosphate transferase